MAQLKRKIEMVHVPRRGKIIWEHISPSDVVSVNPEEVLSVDVSVVCQRLHNIRLHSLDVDISLQKKMIAKLSSPRRGRGIVRDSVCCCVAVPQVLMTRKEVECFFSDIKSLPLCSFKRKK